MPCGGREVRRAAVLVLLAVSLLAVGAVCTEPQAAHLLTYGTNATIAQQGAKDYVLVLDRSGSMRGSKLDRAKTAANDLVDALTRGDRAAVIAFDSHAEVFSALTADKQQLHTAINDIQVGDFTQYSAGLRKAQSLTGANRRIIVFLSDGKPDDNQTALFNLVSQLGKQGTCIFTIAYAASAEADAQQILQRMASISQQETGCGQYFRAGENDFDLQHIFSSIYSRVSSEQVIDVAANVSGDQGVRINTSLSSAINNASLADTCFSPTLTFTVLQGKRVVAKRSGTALSFNQSLPAGQYTYYISAEEECGGACLFTGERSGNVTVSAGPSQACQVPWSKLQPLLNNNKYVEVEIGPKGFSPQSVSTEGVVTWHNADTHPHSVEATDGSWSSPVLQPGQSWTHTFSPGDYSYHDPNADFTGTFRNDNTSHHDPVDLVLVIDRSGSMSGAPLANAKAAADGLLHVLESGDRASLIVFSDDALIVRPLTSDFPSLIAGVNSITSDGSTFYINALKLAGSQVRLSGSTRKALIIFLSDGAPYDPGGKPAIIKAVDSALGDACLYTIGYGDQGVNATDLLASMAGESRAKNDCGNFYFSNSDKSSLSRVFGEIYALTQQPGLDVYDVKAPGTVHGTFVLSAKVRSRANGLAVPSSSTYGCIPQATVNAVFGQYRFPLAYADGAYSGNITLPSGTYKGVITASLTGSDNSAHAVAGAVPVTVHVSGSTWWAWLLSAVIVFLAAKVLIGRRRPSKNASQGGLRVPR